MRKLKEEGLCFMRLHIVLKSPYVFDVADEEGFFLEAEAPAIFRLPSPERAALNVERMVKSYRNHPSVLVWSVSNELHWKGVPEPGDLIALCHRLDPTRPAFASDFSGWSVLGDVICHHYNTFQVFDEWRKHGPGKPMIWDEFGWIWPWDRPVTTGPSGYEYSSQDRSGSGLWNDASKEIRARHRVFRKRQELCREQSSDLRLVPLGLFAEFPPLSALQQLPAHQTGNPVHGRSPRTAPQNHQTRVEFREHMDPTLPEWEPNPGYDIISRS